MIVATLSPLPVANVRFLKNSRNMPFDLKTAVTLGKLVNLAHAAFPTPLPADPAALSLGAANLSFQHFIYAKEPRGSRRGYLPCGFVAKSNPPAGFPPDLFVILGGSEELWDRFKFRRSACSVHDDSENEYGLIMLVETLRVVPDEASRPLVLAIKGSLPVPPALGVANLYVAGRGLAGTLATLVAAKLVVQQIGPSPDLYTFASPAVGEKTFAAWVDQLVPNSHRMPNTPEIGASALVLRAAGATAPP